MKATDPDCILLDEWIEGFRKRAVKLEDETMPDAYAAGAKLLLEEAQEIMSAAQTELEMLNQVFFKGK